MQPLQLDGFHVACWTVPFTLVSQIHVNSSGILVRLLKMFRSAHFSLPLFSETQKSPFSVFFLSIIRKSWSIYLHFQTSKTPNPTSHPYQRLLLFCNTLSSSHSLRSTPEFTNHFVLVCFAEQTLPACPLSLLCFRFLLTPLSLSFSTPRHYQRTYQSSRYTLSPISHTAKNSLLTYLLPSPCAYKSIPTFCILVD